MPPAADFYDQLLGDGRAAAAALGGVRASRPGGGDRRLGAAGGARRQGERRQHPALRAARAPARPRSPRPWPHGSARACARWPRRTTTATSRTRDERLAGLRLAQRLAAPGRHAAAVRRGGGPVRQPQHAVRRAGDQLARVHPSAAGAHGGAGDLDRQRHRRARPGGAAPDDHVPGAAGAEPGDAHAAVAPHGRGGRAWRCRRPMPRGWRAWCRRRRPSPRRRCGRRGWPAAGRRRRG